MSELCKLYCDNYLQCHSRQDSAVTEGKTLDAQEAAWSTAEKNLSENHTDALLAVVALEFEQSLGGLSEGLGDPDEVDSPRKNTLAKFQQRQAETERNFEIVPSELANIRQRQAQNTKDIVSIAKGVSEVDAAVAVCDGPVLNFRGKLRVMADIQLGNSTLPEAYLKDYGVCRSKAARLALEHTPLPDRMYIPFGVMSNVPNFFPQSFNDSL